MKTQYNGNDLFKVDFGLYQYDDIHFEDTKDSILANFEVKYKDKLKKVLDKIGLKYIGLKWFSPKEYNFSNDSLDLIIKITDKNLLKKSILKNKEYINGELSKNKSCDGYMALTISDVSEEIENLKNKDYEMDIIVLGFILRKLIDFSEFDINEYLILEEEK